MADAAQLRELQAQVETAPPAEALAASKQLIDILGPLADESPAKYLTQLATAWQDYGLNLGMVEGPAAALDPLTTAVRLFRDIANDSDALSLLRLTQALQSLSEEHIALEQYEPALELLREARGAGERLGAIEPEAAQMVDAKTSRLLATTHHGRGDFQNAIRYGQEAETGFRSAVRKEPTVLPDFAATLKTLALSLANERADDAQRKEAQRKIDEAMVFYRSLAKQAPEVFLGEYANTAFQAATILMSRGKRMRALGAYENAADLYAKARQVDPGLSESFRIAATAVVEVYEAMGDDRRARKLRQRYGL